MIQRIGASARPDSSAFRRAHATAGRDPSTCVTRAPAAARASVVAPVWAKRWRTLGSSRPASAWRSHGQARRCSGNRPSWPDGLGRSSRVMPSSVTAHGSRTGPCQPPSRSCRRSAASQRSGSRRGGQIAAGAARSTIRSPKRSSRRSSPASISSYALGRSGSGFVMDPSSPVRGPPIGGERGGRRPCKRGLGFVVVPLTLGYNAPSHRALPARGGASGEDWNTSHSTGAESRVEQGTLDRFRRSRACSQAQRGRNRRAASSAG